MVRSKPSFMHPLYSVHTTTISIILHTRIIISAIVTNGTINTKETHHKNKQRHVTQPKLPINLNKNQKHIIENDKFNIQRVDTSYLYSNIYLKSKYGRAM